MCMTRFLPSLRLLLTCSLLLLLGAEKLAVQHGKLSVAIPYHSARPSSGRLVTEILDPEDHVLALTELPLDTAQGDGSWQQVLNPEKPLPFEDIVWQRLRYRFTYADN